MSKIAQNLFWLNIYLIQINFRRKLIKIYLRSSQIAKNNILVRNLNKISFTPKWKKISFFHKCDSTLVRNQLHFGFSWNSLKIHLSQKLLKIIFLAKKWENYNVSQTLINTYLAQEIDSRRFSSDVDKKNNFSLKKTVKWKNYFPYLLNKLQFRFLNFYLFFPFGTLKINSLEKSIKSFKFHSRSR